MGFMELQVVSGVLFSKLTEWVVEEHVEDVLLKPNQTAVFKDVCWKF